MSTRELAEEAADLFHEKLCSFTSFVHNFNPDNSDVNQFRELLASAHKVAGSVTITESVGWYFGKFQKQILKQDTDFMLEYDFEPFMQTMQAHKAFRGYVRMARNLVAMMKDTYRSLDSDEDRIMFNLHVIGLLKIYLQYEMMSKSRS